MRVSSFLTVFLLPLFFLSASAQITTAGQVRGKIADSSNRQSMSAASVYIFAGSDSTALRTTLTDSAGIFVFNGLGPGKYQLRISYEGYGAFRKSFTLSDEQPNAFFPELFLSSKSDILDEVVVERAPITIKKDTVEFNAGSYTTKPNAVAEDLLKKLPGVQVDKSGNISAQGETVTRVLVNGKRFFSDDPKLATRNLPPDVIDRIQVFDDLSDQSKFTGFDDGNRVKTINIVTRKDKRQGYFGRAVAGAGTNGTYDASVNMHRFHNDQQISVLGQANDINKQNFTLQDILGTSGGRRGGGGGGAGGQGGGGQGGGGNGNSSNNGVTSVWAGGANYHDSWGPKTEFYGSYFFNAQHVSTTAQDSTIKPVSDELDSSNTTNSRQSSITENQNHRLFLNLEQKFDSNNSLVFRPNVTFQTSTPHSASSSRVSDNHGTAINSAVGNNSSYNSGISINNASLQFRHKFARPYRSISLDLSSSANVNDGNGTNYSVNNFYKLGQVDTLNQHYNDSLHSLTFSPTLSYTEPIGKNQILEFNYNHTYNKVNTINNTYNFTDPAQGYNQFDSLFSNSYRFLSNSDRFTLNYRLQEKKMNFSAGSGVQSTHFISYNTTKDVTITHSYLNITPTVNFQYSFSGTKRFRLNYSGRTGTPTAAQLQPLTTTTDLINYQVGNPGLRPQFTHSLRMLYTSFNPSTQHVVFATINASTIVNDIQSAVFSNNKGGQQSTYVNLNGTYNISGFFNYGIPLKKPKSNLNFITNVNYSQSQNLQATDSLAAAANDYAHIYVHNSTLGETISWTTNIKKNFDMNFSSATSYNIARRTNFATKSRNNSNLNYFSEVLSAEITAYTNNGWLIATTFDYTYTNNNSAAYNASVPLLNPGIAKQLFKKKNGELRLTVFDLLNQNTSVSKSVSAAGVEAYTRTNVLSRYAMLTFTWNLNNFAAANKRMPGFFPGRFRGGGPGGAPGGAPGGEPSGGSGGPGRPGGGAGRQ